MSKDNDKARQILEAAIHLAYTEGMAKMNANQVARVLGVRSSLIYYYFPKETILYEKMIGFIVLTNNALVEARLASLSKVTVRKRLSVYFEQNLRWAEAHPAQACVMFSGLAASCHNPYLLELLQQALLAGEQKVYQILATGIVESEWMLRHPAREAARMLHQATIGIIAHHLLFHQTQTMDGYLSRLETMADLLLMPPH